MEKALLESQRCTWECTSLDVSPEFSPDICINLLNWDPNEFPRGHFDYIHASCPCEGFSIANKGQRNLDLSNSLVLKTLELLLFFRPLCWSIENPWTGGLRKQEYMQNFSFRKVHYCQYGLPYLKSTIFYNNLGNNWIPRPLCKKDCEFCDEDGRHHTTAQKGKTIGYPRDVDYKTHELWRIPHELCCEIRDAVENVLLWQVEDDEPRNDSN